LAIGNVPEWLTDPGCSLFLQGSNFDKVQGWPNRLLERLCQRVLLATFSNSLFRLALPASRSTVHFDPFGTELL